MTNKPDYNSSELTAYNALRRHGNNTLPISPEEIINSYSNLKLKKYSDIESEYHISIDKVCELLNSDDGVTQMSPNMNCYVIFYNDEIGYEPRIRFTMAHELGHFCLNHFQSMGADYCLEHEIYKYDIHEKEANYFAKKLLVPFPLLQQIILNSSEPLHCSDISTIFGVSAEVAKHVMANWNAYKSCYHRIIIDDEMCNHFKAGINIANTTISFLHNRDNFLNVAY